ncbi:Acetyltransferase (isoleucine patch superfamily) [Azotobacter beijerinckii]|uniref:Acetyltransferase (Isoleucine patch superfamily) n=2 Tax=Azotobacter beijerinckii TaxID=170623 RepID=A0A1H6Y0B3_9GAMM|nr:Acetyltransferase (isoleucine patch superfamily) [Azotobacter beijerinckii]SEJ34733.1 Acetyltransferase (isoleucine patch superfamily) [Azotobacter beijerinckii]
MTTPMQQSIEIYKKYLALCKQYNSKPIFFADLFKQSGEPPNSTIDKRTCTVSTYYSGSPTIQKLTTIGNTNTNIKLVFGWGAKAENILINAYNSDFTIFFSPYCEVKNLVIQAFDQKNAIYIGAGTTIDSCNFLTQGDNQHIFIGHDCMFSTNVHIRTSDSHSLFSYSSGDRLNSDTSVSLGDHVWVGRHATINKGSQIADDTIIGQHSVVTGHIDTHCCYAGVPAKAVKYDITWDRSRVNHRSLIESTYTYRPKQRLIDNFLLQDNSFCGDQSTLEEIERNNVIPNKPYRWLER